MVRFYSELFGLRVMDRGRGRTFNTDLVFMSADPEHHHQLVIASGRPPTESPCRAPHCAFAE
ncbi:MAG: hypothetical protein MZW92_32065 [Comamonadaceae bacterium]|nr:hypothetical protein [Comamonadaceae bacterium]